MHAIPIAGSTDMRMLRFVLDVGTITFEIVAPPFEAAETITREAVRLAAGNVPGTMVAAALDRYREFRALGDPLDAQRFLAIEDEIVAAAGQVCAALAAHGTAGTGPIDGYGSVETTGRDLGSADVVATVTVAPPSPAQLLPKDAPVPVPGEPGGQHLADDDILPAGSWLRICMTVSQKSGLHIQVETQREPAPTGGVIAATEGLIGQIEASLMAVALPRASKLLASKVIKGTVLLQRYATEFLAVVAWERLGLRLHHGRFEALDALLLALPHILADLDRLQDQPLPRFIRPGDAEKRSLAPSTPGGTASSGGGVAKAAKALPPTAKAGPPVAPALAALVASEEVPAAPLVPPGTVPPTGSLPPVAPMQAPIGASQEGVASGIAGRIAHTPVKAAPMAIQATINLLDFLEE